MSFNKLLFCLLLFIAAFFRTAHASHAMNADISYECLGNDSFRVTLNLYRDCSGIDVPTSATIIANSVSCGISNLSFSLPAQPSLNREVSQVCTSSLPQTSCNGGVLPGVELYVYSAVIALPVQCTDWVLSYSLCCRNSMVTTISGVSSYDVYVETRLNNTSTLCNSAPVKNGTIYYLCAGQQVSVNFGATETDGDSLVYALVCPLDAPAVCIAYSAGFSATQPIATTGAFLFNTQTAQATFTPSGPQAGVVAILVNEYRNGVLIGSSQYEIQLIITPCANAIPQVGKIQNLSGGSTTDSITVTTCPGQTVSFQFPVTDINTANSLSVSMYFPGAAGALLTTTGTGNNIMGNFTWTPTGAEVGIHAIQIAATDNACPIVGLTSAVFRINVLAGTDAGNDRYYCTGGVPVQMQATGGTTFSWTPAIGLSATTIANPVATPAVTTSYIVSSNLSSCTNVDTVTVFVVPGFNLDAGAPDTICRNDMAQLQATVTPVGTYTFAWQPASTLLNPLDAAPSARPFSTTTYTAQATAANGCVKRDSVTVHVNGVGPLVVITSDTNNVCPGDTVQLNGYVFPQQCGASALGCSGANPPVSKTFGATGANASAGTPFAGSNEDERYQVLYRASDLNAAGITSGTITRISFEVGTKASTGIYQGFTVKMGCTSATEVSAQAWLPNATTVVAGPSLFNTTLGVNSIPLSVPYEWDGLSNLLIEMCFDNPIFSSASGNDLLLTVAMPYNASVRTVNNNVSGCAIASPQFTYAYAPKITFDICPPLPGSYSFAWVPTTGLTGANTLNPKAVVNTMNSYTLSVTDSLCTGSATIALTTDNSYGIDAIGDTVVCGNGVSQLNALFTGTPPSAILSCGGNGTPCGSAVDSIAIGIIDGSAPTTANGTPYKSLWEDARMQVLYRVSDLQAAGLTGPGVINSISFYIATKRSTNPFEAFTIRIACTTLNTMNSSAGFAQANFTEVYGPISYTSAAGWNKHVFHTPYDWDGTTNLLVEICFNNTSFASSGDDLVAYTTSAGTVLYDNTDNALGCSINTPTSTSNRLNTRFTYCIPPPAIPAYSWSPSTTLSNASIANPLATVAGTTTYHVTATFSDGCRRTDSITVSASSTSINTSISNDTAICVGSAVQLLATGGSAYQWLNPTGLSCSTCPNPVAAPIATTMYTVRIGDTTVHCSVIDSVTITVNGAAITTLADDTILCGQTSVTLDAGTGFASYAWSSGQTTQTLSLSTVGNYTVTVTDMQGCQATASAQVIKDVDCVWPGDANNDGVANNIDVLAIGVAYGHVGAPRANATLNWQPQSALNWADTLANGANYKHADCNGNGTILAEDTLAVSANYGQTHAKGTEYKAGNPPLFFVVQKDTFAEGENVVVTVSLGQDTLEVINFYGIAFTLDYNNTLADASSIEYEAEQSFAGTPTINALGYDRPLFFDSKHAVAFTRTNGNNVNGYGQIGTFSFNIKDSLTWSVGETIKTINLTYSDVLAIDAQENEIALSPVSKAIVVKRSTVGVTEVPAATLAVYPNPAHQNIIATSNAVMREVTLHDVLGKTLLHFTNVAAKNFKLDASALANGNYLLKVKTERGEVAKRVVIVR